MTASPSGTAGVLKSGIPVGKVVIQEKEDSQQLTIEFFSDFTQLQYVSVTSFVNNKENILKKEQSSKIKSDNKVLPNNLNVIQSADKLNILLKEKEINEELRKKIELENNQLKNQISEIQKTLFKNQKILEDQNKIIQNLQLYNLALSDT